MAIIAVSISHEIVEVRVGISQINRRRNASKEKSLNSLNTALNDVAKQVAGRARVPFHLFCGSVTPEHSLLLMRVAVPNEKPLFSLSHSRCVMNDL